MGGQNAQASILRYTWPWLLVGGVLIALLAWRLDHTANPWQAVSTIRSDIDRSTDKGLAIVSPHSEQRGDISPDGRFLAVARPDGTVAVHDLAQDRLHSTVAQPTERDEDSGTHFKGSQFVQFVAGSRHVLVAGQPQPMVYRLNGEAVPVEGLDSFRAMARSSTDDRFATLDIDRVHLFDLSKRRTIHSWHLERANGGRQRLQWAPDERHLLVSDFLSVRVIDTRTGETRFAHRELDLTLPPPMISEPGSGFDATGSMPPGPDGASAERSKDESHIAAIQDACFSPDGTLVATLYNPDPLLGEPSPETHRLRFYDSRTGKLLWDHVLEHESRNMRFSPNGDRLYVLVFAARGRHHHIDVFDVDQRQRIDRIHFDHLGDAPYHFTLLADGRTIAAVGVDLLLVDAEGEYSPLFLTKSLDTHDILETESPGEFVEIGRYLDVRIWQQARDRSVVGAFARPATWGIYLVALVTVVGMLCHASRRSAQHDEVALPGSLFWIVMLLGVFQAWTIADAAIRHVTAPLLETRGDREDGAFTIAFRWAIHLLWLHGLVGLMLLRQGWRRLLIGITAICVAAFLLLLAVNAIFHLTDPTALDGMVHSLHGMRVTYEPWHIYAIFIGGLLIMTLFLITLFRPAVRQAFEEARSADVQ